MGTMGCPRSSGRASVSPTSANRAAGGSKPLHCCGTSPCDRLD
jgi:hypothetical protein